MTKARLRNMTKFLIGMDKDFLVKSWENLEGKDIIVDEILISIPNSQDSIVTFLVNEDKLKEKENGNKIE